jgi:GT2 family glycosyltransferase
VADAGYGNPWVAGPSGPRILLVIPTLGRRNELMVQTIESIKQQEGESADVIVVCPREAAQARRIAAEYGAAVADDPGSMAGALNVGMAHALPRHVYVNWIGDDDLLRPGALAATARALDEHPQARLAYGGCDYIDAAGRVLWTNRSGRYASWVMRWGPDLIPQPGALFRLEDVAEVGGMDPTLAYAMDLDLWLRLHRLGPFVYTGRTLAAFRWHPDSVTVANRHASLAETQAVQERYHSTVGHRTKIIWQGPVRAATRLAARQLNRRAHRARLGEAC